MAYFVVVYFFLMYFASMITLNTFILKKKGMIKWK